METEFRRTEPEREWRSLMLFDRKIFPAGDCFPASYWRAVESYWLLVDGKKVGCCAFERHVDMQEDVRSDGLNLPHSGTLYIVSTGIAPERQGRGFGRLMKAWQICFARQEGFRRVITNVRSRNRAMRKLNQEFGFRVLRITKGYYADPPDATVVMELRLPPTRA